MTTAPRRLFFDTNVAIHLLRATTVGARIVERFQLDNTADVPFISIVSVGEARSFARQRGWGPAKTKQLHELLRTFAVVGIESEPVIDAYAELDAFSRSVGRRMGKNDAWIAASASVLGATLVTCDADFEHLSPPRLDVAFVESGAEGAS